MIGLLLAIAVLVLLGSLGLRQRRIRRLEDDRLLQRLGEALRGHV